MSDWNAQIIDEFRANHGRVGGQFEGAPLILLHHRGRKSGADHVSPAMSLADESDPDTLYVFASKAGAPTHPEWYRNLVSAGRGRVELGDGEYEVDVTELEGEARDRILPSRRAAIRASRNTRTRRLASARSRWAGAPAPALNQSARATRPRLWAPRLCRLSTVRTDIRDAGADRPRQLGDR